MDVCGRVHNHHMDASGDPCGAGDKARASTFDKVSTKAWVDSALPGRAKPLGITTVSVSPPWSIDITKIVEDLLLAMVGILQNFQ